MMWTAGIQVKWICDHRGESQFKQLRNSPKKSFSGLQRDSNRWSLRSRCSALIAWAMKTHTLEAGQFIEFINPWKEWNTEWKNCDSLRWSHIHFICIPAVHIISFCVSFLSRVDNSINWPASSVWVFIAQAGRALQRERRGHGFESRRSPEKLFFGLFRNCLNCDSLRWSHIHFIYTVYMLQSV